MEPSSLSVDFFISFISLFLLLLKMAITILSNSLSGSFSRSFSLGSTVMGLVILRGDMVSWIFYVSVFELRF